MNDTTKKFEPPTSPADKATERPLPYASGDDYEREIGNLRKERDALLQALRDCVYMIGEYSDSLRRREDFKAAAEIIRLDNLKNGRSWVDTTEGKRIRGIMEGGK